MKATLEKRLLLGRVESAKQPIRATRSFKTPPPACKLASHSAVSANTHIHKCTHSMMSSSPWEIETVNTVVCIQRGDEDL